ncbi:DMT family transporter [Sulfitobacter donghicola]|uniref:Membrane protein n=1 Tax=Sulfitobacter donghicola DSW-25 = KCTC 12864 = JCM 14565 TaxID=1300350 RepID=A0A073IFK6_9RHOB|nr:DMT family transporter [Sulfitobacter donghicola]KEJ89128.1 membrane protein [Sulfitobacter donghicola DSW-25 = KCTC 12864 = JCM 14565]KIN67295.1 Membrane protein [Sulfitobacter donghicola DSW-25 = KCTC 12864 = JCM 14565]
MQRAVFVMFLAMSLIPTGDSAAKILTSSYDTAPIFAAWSRFVFGALILLPLAPRNSWALLANWRIWLRALSLALSIFCIQQALQIEDMATVFAAFFIGPLVSFVLAALFLKEQVSPLRTLLVIIGFVGVVIVVRPGHDVSTGVLWAVASGASYGAFLTMSRWLGPLASPMAMTFIQLFISALLFLPFGAAAIPPFSGAVVGLTAASAVCSMLGNLLLLYVYTLVPATRLAPLVYFQLVAAVGLGWFIFAELPDVWTMAGLAIILTSGIVSTRLR